jgi:general stress protein 26
MYFADIEPEFIVRARRIVWCNVATVDTAGRPRSRVLHPIWEGATGWILTRRTSLKARHLARHPHVSLAYVADPVKPLYVDGVADWEDDLSAKRRIWEAFKAAPPPLGYDPGTIWSAPEAPNCGLLGITARRIQLDDMLGARKVWTRAGDGA